MDKTNYGLIMLLVFLLHGLMPLDAAKPIIAKSEQELTQLKNKFLKLSKPATEPPAMESYRKEIPHESSKSINTDDGENTIQLINEWKQDSTNYLPWNGYGLAEQPPLPLPYHFPISMLDAFSTFAAMSQTSKMLPLFGYPNPILLPYNIGMTPEMLYTNFAENIQTSEDNMSRARRPTNTSPNFQRNSPIYYVRLPPSPYIFLPNFNYAPPTSSINSYMRYPSLSSFNALPMSSIYNLPMNFLANGKPNRIYRIDDSSNNLEHERFSYTEPNMLSNSNLSPYLPFTSPAHFLPKHHSHPFGLKPPTSSLLPETAESYAKRPYIFNGRPKDVYFLPNSLYPEGNFY